jgi:hypothetical protein
MASILTMPGTANSSDYSSRRVSIQVTGGSSDATMRLGAYTLSVPYDCFSKTIQGIHRQGGVVTGVVMPNSSNASVQSKPSKSSATAPLKTAPAHTNAPKKGKKES